MANGRIRCPVCATEIKQIAPASVIPGGEWEIVRVTPAAERRRLPRFERPRWRVGSKVSLNVYEGDPGRPICQAHTVADATFIVDAANEFRESAVLHALEELVKLQAHYARLLNAHDGGERKAFESAEQWMERLKEVERRNGE